jgi:hypothetical protein
MAGNSSPKLEASLEGHPQEPENQPTSRMLCQPNSAKIALDSRNPDAYIARSF